MKDGGTDVDSSLRCISFVTSISSFGADMNRYVAIVMNSIAIPKRNGELRPISPGRRGQRDSTSQVAADGSRQDRSAGGRKEKGGEMCVSRWRGGNEISGDVVP